MKKGHSHTPATGKHLVIAIILNAVIFIIELIGGIFTNSLALISDSLHNLSDFFALILSYIANKSRSMEIEFRKILRLCAHGNHRRFY